MSQDTKINPDTLSAQITALSEHWESARLNCFDMAVFSAMLKEIDDLLLVADECDVPKDSSAAIILAEMHEDGFTITPRSLELLRDLSADVSRMTPQELLHMKDILREADEWFNKQGMSAFYERVIKYRIMAVHRDVAHALENMPANEIAPAHHPWFNYVRMALVSIAAYFKWR